MFEKVFLKPGKGRVTPLPIPGGGSVPKEGAMILRDLTIERLIISGDLVEAKEPPAPEANKAELPTVAAEKVKG